MQPTNECLSDLSQNQSTPHDTKVDCSLASYSIQHTENLNPDVSCDQGNKEEKASNNNITSFDNNNSAMEDLRGKEIGDNRLTRKAIENNDTHGFPSTINMTQGNDKAGVDYRLIDVTNQLSDRIIEITPATTNDVTAEELVETELVGRSVDVEEATTNSVQTDLSIDETPEVDAGNADGGSENSVNVSAACGGQETGNESSSIGSCDTCLRSSATDNVLATTSATEMDIVDDDREGPCTSIAEHCCETCGKRFTAVIDLTRHRRTHKEKIHACEECGKRFNRFNSYMRHKQTHTGNKPFTCDICQKKFTRSSTLDQHKRMHTGERPFVCDVCGKAYTSSGSLLTHARTHSGDKPFSCEHCNRKFLNTSHLKRHLITHSQKRTTCDICGKSFKDPEYAVKHFDLHRQGLHFICDVCSKVFTTQKEFDRHKGFHYVDTSLICEVCGRKSSSKEHFARHEMIHEGAETYRCDICNKGFHYHFRMEQHKKKMHSGSEDA